MIDTLYYGDQQCHCGCGHHHFHNVDGAVRFNADVLAKFLKTIYRGFDTDHGIEASMWREVLRIINEGTVEGFAKAKTPPTHDVEFYKALRHSNEVFAAFKVHAMGVEMAAKLYDADGRLKPFAKWADDVRSISSHQVGSWLQTEYDTAVIRAHTAADWREFERNKDILPNLRWMPTTSKEPESSHREYWVKKLTLPVDDPFWEKHHPGDRWNCKCSLEATDDPVVRPDDMEPTKPQRGLENNPGKDGHTFSDNHPYFPNKCSQCFAYKKSGLHNCLQTFFSNKKKKNCYDCPFINNCIPDTSSLKKIVKSYIQTFKKGIEQNGTVLKSKMFKTGKLRILPRSLKDVYEHEIEDRDLLEWLLNFNLGKIKKWKYEGWAENRPYEPSHPKFDPNDPDKRKHPETEYFIYYSLKIKNKRYWANVKVHKNYHSEVLYTIESKKPDDLLKRKRKK